MNRLITNTFLLLIATLATLVILSKDSPALSSLPQQQSDRWLQDNSAICGGSEPSPRIVVGQRGWVLPEPPIPNTLRRDSNASSNDIGNIQPGEHFDVIGGPICSSNINRWQVLLSDGTMGWTGEGDQSGYWIGPTNEMNSSTRRAYDRTCSGISIQPRLQIGSTGTVLPADSPNALNSHPGQPSRNSNIDRVGTIPVGGSFRVIGGPTCTGNDTILWWRVDYRGTIGWTGEGSGNTYWVRLGGDIDTQIANASGSSQSESPIAVQPPRQQITSNTSTRSGGNYIGTATARENVELNVRSAPSQDSTVLGRIYHMDMLPLLGESGDWLIVEFNGQQAYVSSRWAEANYGSIPTGPTFLNPYVCDNGILRAQFDIGDRGYPATGEGGSSLRSAPGGDAFVTIPEGQVFTVIGGPQCTPNGTMWFEVSYNNRTGWLSQGNDGQGYWTTPIGISAYANANFEYSPASFSEYLSTVSLPSYIENNPDAINAMYRLGSIIFLSPDDFETERRIAQDTLGDQLIVEVMRYVPVPDPYQEAPYTTLDALSRRLDADFGSYIAPHPNAPLHQDPLGAAYMIARNRDPVTVVTMLGYDRMVEDALRDSDYGYLVDLYQDMNYAFSEEAMVDMATNLVFEWDNVSTSQRWNSSTMRTIEFELDAYIRENNWATSLDQYTSNWNYSDFQGQLSDWSESVFSGYQNPSWNPGNWDFGQSSNSSSDWTFEGSAWNPGNWDFSGGSNSSGGNWNSSMFNPNNW